MNEQISVSLTITNDRGEEISPLVRQDVPLDGKFTNLLNTMNRLNAIKNAQAVTFNIHPVRANGSPADGSPAEGGLAGGSLADGSPAPGKDQDAPFWMVSFVTRHNSGSLIAQELLPFRSKAMAEDFTRRLVDAFQEGRKISISTDPSFMQQQRAQRPSAEVHQLVRPASTGFSPGI
ncbi:MAG: hypothetical protein ACYCS8_16290 [Acidithiobacillus sp.]